MRGFVDANYYRDGAAAVKSAQVNTAHLWSGAFCAMVSAVLPYWDREDELRIIARRTLREYAEQPPDVAGQLDAWYHDAKRAGWATPADITRVYKSASILPNQRVVFNIKGNQYRLIVMIHYAHKIVYVRWFGTHQAYDRIDATTV
jgi:mRNA interferase HigB